MLLCFSVVRNLNCQNSDDEGQGLNPIATRFFKTLVVFLRTYRGNFFEAESFIFGFLKFLPQKFFKIEEHRAFSSTAALRFKLFQEKRKMLKKLEHFIFMFKI